MKSLEVAQIVYDIRSKIEQNQSLNEEKYSEFKKEYPSLYNKCISEDYNSNQMLYFLSKLKEIDDNKTSEHEASVNIGTMLVDKYVKPFIKEEEKSN